MPGPPLKVAFCILLVLGVLLIKPAAAEPDPSTSKQPEPAQGIRNVFIISIDGLNYEGYISTHTPNMDHLAQEGTVDKKALTFRVNSIEASEASLITGTFPEEHKYISASDKVEVESVFDQIKKSGRKVLLIDGSGGKLQNLGANLYTKVDAKANDRTVFQEAIKQFETESPFLTYIYSNDCLDALLSLNEKEYYQSITRVDQYIGELLNSLRKAGIYYQSLVIVTSPRSSSLSNLSPLIIHGPGCKSGVIVSDTMLIDVAPTISNMLGMKPPFSALGIPLYDSMKIEPRDQLYILNQWVKGLKADRIATWNRYFESQDELFRTIKQLMSVKEERQNIFNFAGQREETIISLQKKVQRERMIAAAVFLLMVAGYAWEYKWLKKRFLLFR